MRNHKETVWQHIHLNWFSKDVLFKVTRTMGIFVLTCLLSACAIGTTQTESPQKASYPTYKLIVPKSSQITEYDPPGAIKVHDQGFIAFMQNRANDQSIFFLSISIPWELEIEEELSLMTIPHEILEEDGKTINIALPTGLGSYMFGDAVQFESGFGRTTVDRFNERSVHMGFFQVFKETCFGGGHCFYKVQFVPPDPKLAMETYKEFQNK